MDTAVVLVSGGVNSLVATGLAAKEFTPALMHVSYGQRSANRDLTCFREICKHYDVGKKLHVSLDYFQAIGGSARVDKKQAIEDARALGDTISNTYVPGLIPTLLGLALHWASAIGARHIIVGSSEDDGALPVQTSALFPDHRRELYHLYNQLIEMTSKRDSTIQLRTPLIEMGRAEVIRLGDRLMTPFEKTWSCDRSGQKPCCTCYGCVSRAHGFVKAAVADPIMIDQQASQAPSS